MTIIDSHQHVFWHGRDDAGLIADMDEHGIDLAWLLTWEIAPWEDETPLYRLLNPLNARSDGSHAGIVLADLLCARDRYPERFVVGYCPHPMIGDAVALLRAAVAIHKVQVCGEWKFRLPFDDPRCLELFRAAGELGLPVVLHLDAPYLPDSDGRPLYKKNWRGGTIENLERALRACPDTVFIGHAPGFWREISGDAQTIGTLYPNGPIVAGGRLPALLENYSNLYADLSAGSGRIALERDPAHAQTFLTRFADRLLFGRDFYGQELHRCLQSLDITDEVAAKIYGLNAQRLLKVGASKRAA